MKTNLKLAWRNLWRNKRRTLITTSSIVFSVFFACLMRSMQEGSYDSMIGNLVKFYSGYLQIQDTAYWEEKTLENSIDYDSVLNSKIERIEDILLISPRLESFALSAYKENSRPVFVIGINPEKENQIIKLVQKIIAGNFITSADEGALIAEGLARYLKIEVGDTLVMISQGYHGVSSAGKFAVRAIFKHPSPDFNNNMVFLSLAAAQNFYSAEGRYTSNVIMVEDHFKVKHVKKAIADLLPSNKKVMTWDEMHPELMSMVEGDREGGYVMLWVLYGVIGFGIFGTVLMMVNERRREFGVINAIGMQKVRINLMLFFEIILLALLGVIGGLVLTTPAVCYFYNNPLPLTGDLAEAMGEYGMEPYMFFSIRPIIFIIQGITIFGISAGIAFIMMIGIARLKIIKALRS
jgi:lipoprotein-releasing system permease protein